MERAVRVSRSSIGPHVLHQAIGEERAPRSINEKTEVEMIVKELEPKVVAKIRYTSHETAYVGASPARGPD